MDKSVGKTEISESVAETATTATGQETTTAATTAATTMTPSAVSGETMKSAETTTIKEGEQPTTSSAGGGGGETVGSTKTKIKEDTLGSISDDSLDLNDKKSANTETEQAKGAAGDATKEGETLIDEEESWIDTETRNNTAMTDFTENTETEVAPTTAGTEIQSNGGKKKKSTSQSTNNSSNSSTTSNSSKHQNYQQNANANGRSGIQVTKDDMGAISFKLPGKITHKTTIRLAHYPQPWSEFMNKPAEQPNNPAVIEDTVVIDDAPYPCPEEYGSYLPPEYQGQPTFPLDYYASNDNLSNNEPGLISLPQLQPSLMQYGPQQQQRLQMQQQQYQQYYNNLNSYYQNYNRYYRNAYMQYYNQGCGSESYNNSNGSYYR